MLAEHDAWRRAAQSLGASPALTERILQEKRYRSARKNWTQYLAWKASRNPARAALEEKHGYDTKHATHLVRLLRMGMELLQTGELHVWRGGIDAEELCQIRAGAWEYDRLIEWAEQKQAALQALYQSKQIAVPAQPDRKAIDALCTELMLGFLRRGPPT